MRKLFLISCTMFLFSLGAYSIGGQGFPYDTKGVIIDNTGNDQNFNDAFGHWTWTLNLYPTIEASTNEGMTFTSVPDTDGITYKIVTRNTANVRFPAVLKKDVERAIDKNNVWWNTYYVFVPCATEYDQGQPVCHFTTWDTYQLP